MESLFIIYYLLFTYIYFDLNFCHYYLHVVVE